MYLNFIPEIIIFKGNKAYKKELLKKITKPFTNLFVQLDKNVLKTWSFGGDEKGEAIHAIYDYTYIFL